MRNRGFKWLTARLSGASRHRPMGRWPMMTRPSVRLFSFSALLRGPTVGYVPTAQLGLDRPTHVSLDLRPFIIRLKPSTNW
jgi:hypothetical protein